MPPSLFPSFFEILTDKANDLLQKTPTYLPSWLNQEILRRVVLLINHILQQEPIAMQRLRPHQDSTISIVWNAHHLDVKITPAGLFNLTKKSDAVPPSLTILAQESNAFTLAKMALNKGKPDLHMQGSVNLASELNWLAENLRWDLEEDLSRLVGDAPAVAMVSCAKNLSLTLKTFIQQRTKSTPSHETTPAH